jgi:hypothetical protein
MEMLDMNSSRVQRATEQIACDMDGEVVVLDLKSGIYYGLDAVGARVWSLIEQPASLAAIRDAIMSEYDVDAESCDRDILVFVKRMQELGLIDVSDVSNESPR